MSEKVDIKPKRISAAAIIICIAAVIISFALGFIVRGEIVGKDAAAMSEIVAYLNNYGVFDSKTGELGKLSVEDAARAIIDQTPDAYATYYSPSEYKAVKDMSNGTYEGLGITVRYTETEVIIDSIRLNSPSYYARLKEGDIIVGGTISGEYFEFSGSATFMSFIEKAGKNVFGIKVRRGEEEITAELKKAPYISSYVFYADSEKAFAFLGNDKLSLVETEDKMPSLPSDTAYIRLYEFESDAETELKNTLNLMKERGRNKLILDLRKNPGGYMNVLSGICGALIYNGGKSAFPVVYYKDAKGNFTAVNSGGNAYNKFLTDISVLADQTSASATECLIGAMAYYGGAFDMNKLIIENESLTDGYARTYGKGIMQTTFNLSNGGALKLTTAVVYQPDKETSIHGKGIRVSGENALIKSDNSAVARAIAVLHP